MTVREIHGVAGVTKVSMTNTETQAVRVMDGSDGTVILALSANTYPAGLTPEQARFIAKCLEESADRVEALG